MTVLSKNIEAIIPLDTSLNNKLLISELREIPSYSEDSQSLGSTPLIPQQDISSPRSPTREPSPLPSAAERELSPLHTPQLEPLHPTVSPIPQNESKEAESTIALGSDRPFKITLPGKGPKGSESKRDPAQSSSKIKQSEKSKEAMKHSAFKIELPEKPDKGEERIDSSPSIRASSPEVQLIPNEPVSYHDMGPNLRSQSSASLGEAKGIDKENDNTEMEGVDNCFAADVNDASADFVDKQGILMIDSRFICNAVLITLLKNMVIDKYLFFRNKLYYISLCPSIDE